MEQASLAPTCTLASSPTILPPSEKQPSCRVHLCLAYGHRIRTCASLSIRGLTESDAENMQQAFASHAVKPLLVRRRFRDSYWLKKDIVRKGRYTARCAYRSSGRHRHKGALVGLGREAQGACFLAQRDAGLDQADRTSPPFFPQACREV